MPPFPDELDYLWRWWSEIIEGTEGNGFGAPRTGWLVLAAWSDLSRTLLEPWEARALVKIGNVFASVHNEDIGKTKPGTK